MEILDRIKSGTQYRNLVLEGRDDGMIVEKGTPDEIFGDPKEKRTQDFLSKVL